MPTGLCIMHWDDRIGVEIIQNYPEELIIQEKTLMQIYSQHEFTGDAGMVSLNAGAINLASYYTGPDTAYYIIIQLISEEDPEIFEEALSDMARQIIPNLESPSLKALLPGLFQRLSVYPTMSEEQRYSTLVADEYKRQIFTRIREEILISKSELAIWLRDIYREGMVDVDSIIAPLIKNGIIKIGSIKGLSSDMLFFVEDLGIMRIPPLNLLLDPVDRHLPASLKDAYIQEVKNYFKHYKPSESDNVKIIDDIFLNPACYEVLKLLREAIVTRNDLEKLRKKGVDDVDKVLKTYWENKMVAVLQDNQGTEYYCLTCDFKVKKFFPRYAMDKIRDLYRKKIQNNNALVRALDVLREEYLLVSKGIDI